MKKFFIVLVSLIVGGIVFAEQRIDSIKVNDWSITRSGSGETVAKYILPYLSAGYVQSISYDSKQKCLIIMYDTDIHKSQRVVSIRYHNLSFTASGSGKGVVKSIKNNIGNKYISAFTYDEEQGCIIVVYEG